MKKLVFGLAMVAAAACFGDAANRLIWFSTPGTDTYADGATVLDGERYALVYVVGDFDGIAADGTSVGNDKVFAILPRAKNGRCPLTCFQVDSVEAKEWEAKGGSYNVYLLDTRLATGSLAPLSEDGMTPTTISSATKVETTTAIAAAAMSSTAAKADAPVVASAAAGVKPTVKSIKVEGAYVYITVPGSMAALKSFSVAGGATPDAVNTTLSGTKDVTDEDVTIVVPKSDDNRFFKVQSK